MKVDSFRLIGGDIDGLRIPSVETLPEDLTQNLLVRHQGRLKYFDKSKGWSEAVRNSLFPFSSHTFTSASVRGSIGPTLAQCIAAYSSDWKNNPDFFTVQSGFQVWTVPETGTYRIEAVGASGASNGTIDQGGRGARVAADYQLTQGQKLVIGVGQCTNGASTTGGTAQAKAGGGGSFVFLESKTLANCIIAAGGGGGTRTSSVSSHAHASLTTSGNSVQSGSSDGAGGTNGNGGRGGISSGGQGGAGLISDGANPSSASSGRVEPRSIISTATGGLLEYGVYGGFGGGGGWWGGGGGGGGYSGGGGGNWNSTSAVDAGGGGSYVSSSVNRLLTHRSDRGNGSVTITKL